jgi:hypothetical protein
VDNPPNPGHSTKTAKADMEFTMTTSTPAQLSDTPVQELHMFISEEVGESTSRPIYKYADNLLFTKGSFAVHDGKHYQANRDILGELPGQAQAWTQVAFDDDLNQVEVAA